ncbi:hypothetical protein QUB47_14070 [Microcoleus sp. AT9_B5]
MSSDTGFFISGPIDRVAGILDGFGQNVIALIHQLQLLDLSDRQKAEIIAEFLPLCNSSER